MRETFFLRRRANFDSKFVPGPAEEQRRERESVWCFSTESNITTVAEARADAAGVMVRNFGHEATVENNGGTGVVGVDPEQEVGGASAFVVEFKMARIDDAAFFGVTLVVVAKARGAVDHPWVHGADQDREQVQV
jgi:hypothetical protein